MAKTVIREVPKELPNAHIYIDDLFEIEDLIESTYKELEPESQVEFEYEIDGRNRFTTREELLEFGGYSSNFYLFVSAKQRIFRHKVLSINKCFRPEFESPYDFKNQKWEIYGKVNHIFKVREDRLKNNIMALPQWSMFFLLLFVSCPALANNKWITHFIDPKVFYIVEAIAVFVALIACYEIFKKNRIYFEYFRQDQRAKGVIRKQRLEKLGWMFLGVLLGVLGAIARSLLIRK